MKTELSERSIFLKKKKMGEDNVETVGQPDLGLLLLH